MSDPPRHEKLADVKAPRHLQPEMWRLRVTRAALIAAVLAACDGGHPPRPAGVAAWCTTYQPKDGPTFQRCWSTEAECGHWTASPGLVIGAQCQRFDRAWCYGGHGVWPIFCEPSEAQCEHDLAHEQLKGDPKLQGPCAPFPD